MPRSSGFEARSEPHDIADNREITERLELMEIKGHNEDKEGDIKNSDRDRDREQI
jgi:hypothetical protein